MTHLRGWSPESSPASRIGSAVRSPPGLVDVRIFEVALGYEDFKSTVICTAVTALALDAAMLWLPWWLYLNRDYATSDRRIVLGCVEPHFMASFSGGHKGIFPALTEIDSITEYHGAAVIADPRSTWGVLCGNPTQERIRRYGALLPVDFCVNATVNRDGQITGFYCGEPIEAHETGCVVAKQAAMVACLGPFDVVVTTNGAYQLDQNLHQAVKGMSAAAQIVRKGGYIVATDRPVQRHPARGSPPGAPGARGRRRPVTRGGTRPGGPQRAGSGPPRGADDDLLPGELTITSLTSASSSSPHEIPRTLAIPAFSIFRRGGHGVHGIKHPDLVVAADTILPALSWKIRSVLGELLGCAWVMSQGSVRMTNEAGSRQGSAGKERSAPEAACKPGSGSGEANPQHLR